MRKTILFVLGIACACETSAQDLPQVIPPSPTAMQIHKYGDYPVGHFTGVPEISIPLYTIAEGELSLPISMDYHASGIKVSDTNGFYGTGWSLNAGGIVSVTIKGPDDQYVSFPSPMLTADELDYSTASDILYMHGVESGGKNTEYDLYSYSFGGNSGKFCLKNDASRTPILFPYKPLKITKTMTGPNFKNFQIIDEQGTVYKFGPHDNGINGGRSYIGSNASTGGGSWLASEIASSISPQNRILFKYNAGVVETSDIRNEKLIVDDSAPGEQYWDCTWNGTSQNFQYAFKFLPYKTPFRWTMAHHAPPAPMARNWSARSPLPVAA